MQRSVFVSLSSLSFALGRLSVATQVESRAASIAVLALRHASTVTPSTSAPSTSFAAAPATTSSSSPPSSIHTPLPPSERQAQTMEELFRRIEVTPELRDWIYRSKPSLCPSFVVMSVVKNAGPKGLTMPEIWEQVRGLHESLVTKRVLKRHLYQLARKGYKNSRLVLAQAKPHFYYMAVPVYRRKSKDDRVRRAAKEKNRELRGVKQE